MEGAILAAALKLYVEEGFQQVTMRRIADAIEYTPGAIYAYFKDKDEILYALHMQGFEQLGAMFRPLEKITDPFERLDAIGRMYLRFALENRELYDLMFLSGSLGERIEACDEWQPGENVYDLLRRTVRACLKSGRIPDHDLESATYACWALVHGLASLVIRRRTSMIPAEAIDHIVEGGFNFFMHAKLAPTPS